LDDYQLPWLRVPIPKDLAASQPSAKILRFNPAGKAIPDVMSPDRAYVAQYFRASVHWGLSEKEISAIATAYRIDERKDYSYLPCVREAKLSATKGITPTNPTLPAA
jgi:hypothetical protein